jgi:hypothetical protein
VLLDLCLSAEESAVKYFACTGSPLRIASPKCSNVLLGYLTDAQNMHRTAPMLRHFSLDSITRILTLDERSSYEYLEKLAPIDNEPFNLLLDGTLKSSGVSFWKVNEFKEL